MKALVWACLLLLLAVAARAAATPEAPTEGLTSQEEMPRTDRSGEWYRGVTIPSKQVTLAVPLDGLLGEVAVEEGDHVEKDQLLARMDDGLQVMAVEAAELEALDTSELYQAELILEEAQYELEQILLLHTKDASTELEVRRARLRSAQAAAAIKVAEKHQALAKGRLDRERERLVRYQIRAPFEGHIIALGADTEAGATLRQGDKLMVLVKLDRLETHLYLPLELYGQLQVGQTYQLQAEMPVNRQLSGRLIYCEPRIDLASSTFRCVFEIDNPGAALPSGFMVRLLWPQPEAKDAS